MEILSTSGGRRPAAKGRQGDGAMRYQQGLGIRSPRAGLGQQARRHRRPAPGRRGRRTAHHCWVPPVQGPAGRRRGSRRCRAAGGARPRAPAPGPAARETLAEVGRQGEIGKRHTPTRPELLPAGSTAPRRRTRHCCAASRAAAPAPGQPQGQQPGRCSMGCHAKACTGDAASSC